MKFIFSIFSLRLVLLCSLHQVALADGANIAAASGNSLLETAARESARFAPWKTVELQADVVTAFTAEYRELNPKEDFANLHNRTDKVTYVSDGHRYAYDIVTTTSSGVQLPGTQAVADNDRLFVLNRKDGHVYTKLLPNEGHGSIDAKNPLTIFYSFLADDTDEESFAPVTIQDIQDVERWKKLRVGKPAEDGGMTLVRKLADGSTDEVRFAPVTFAPVAFTRKNGKGEIARSVSVSKMERVAGGTVSVPTEVSVGLFFKGWKIADVKMAVRDVQINKALTENAFEYDPGLGHYIYDGDSKIMITVPK